MADFMSDSDSHLIDMSLDDIIKLKRKTSQNARFQNRGLRGRGAAGNRRFSRQQRGNFSNRGKYVQNNGQNFKTNFKQNFNTSLQTNFKPNFRGLRRNQNQSLLKAKQFLQRRATTVDKGRGLKMQVQSTAGARFRGKTAFVNRKNWNNVNATAPMTVSIPNNIATASRYNNRRRRRWGAVPQAQQRQQQQQQQHQQQLQQRQPFQWDARPSGIVGFKPSINETARTLNERFTENFSGSNTSQVFSRTIYM